jgi:hypothetical protein
MARLWRDWGKREEARELLARGYTREEAPTEGYHSLRGTLEWPVARAIRRANGR